MALSAGLICLAPPARAGSSVSSLAGNLLGEVRNSAGVAQMGATVLLYNRFDKIVRQSLTNEQGRFAFASLAPDVYSIRVTLASFVPAVKRNIQIVSGADKLLEINLATILSTVDIVASPPTHGNLMSDDWKWLLRSAQSTIPVLRFAPDASVSSSSSTSLASMFSDTRGMLKISAGDAESLIGTSQEDLGTAFALATSISGSARVQLSGNLGYAAATGIPTSGFRTTYSRTKDDGQSGTQIALTVQQLYSPSRISGAVQSSANGTTTDGIPALRTFSLAAMDRLNPTDWLHIEYGFNMESVTFLTRLNYLSPFGRVTYDLGKGSALRLAVSSGMQPTELVTGGVEAAPEMDQDLTALALLPHLSMLDGRARVERTQSIEASYQKVQGSRTWSAGAYTEDVLNAALTMSAFSGALRSADLMPDLASNSYILNVGNYNRVGYTASVKQNLGDHVDVSVSAGEAGALAAADPRLIATTAGDFRGLLREANRPWATTRVSGRIPLSGTRIIADYGWTQSGAIMPPHLSLTEQSNQVTGFNIYVRQPLPAFPGMPGRLEATAEMLNMLAQGYLSASVNGQQTYLTDTPRAVRGGLSIIF